MNIDEIKKPEDKDEDEQKEQNISMKQKMTIKKIIMFAAIGIVIIAGIFILKNILFKKPENSANFLQTKIQTKPIIRKSTSFLNITNPKPVIPVKIKTVKHTNQALLANNFDKNKNIVIKKSKSSDKNKVFGVPTIPLMPAKSIKEMLKFNNEVNSLGQKLKIARLEQEIKSLHQNSAGGLNTASTESNIFLIAITKNTAIIAFGKHNVSMKVGMKYGGYKCLMITSAGVALERNNRVINLSLSM
ncbi:MAG: hypothetical protein ACYCTB_11085 [bacterium]